MVQFHDSALKVAMPNLHDAILDKYAKTQDEHILQYAFDHCTEAYFDILKKYDHDRFLRECPHTNQGWSDGYAPYKCLDCGKELPQPRIWWLDGFDWVDDFVFWAKWTKPKK